MADGVYVPFRHRPAASPELGETRLGPFRLWRVRYVPVHDRPEETIPASFAREHDTIDGDHSTLQAALLAAPPGRYFVVGHPGDHPARLLCWFKAADGTCYRGRAPT